VPVLRRVAGDRRTGGRPGRSRGVEAPGGHAREAWRPPPAFA
jgi:hypothetical protein